MASSSLLSAAVIAVVAVVSLVLFFVTFSARRRTGNRLLLLVSLGFLTFFVKGAVVSALLLDGRIQHDLLEILEASLDLVVILLLALPLVLRR